MDAMDYGTLAMQNKLLKERITRLEKKSIDIVHCEECIWFTQSQLRYDGKPDKRCKQDWCDYHRIVRSANAYCSDGRRK